MCMHSRGPYMSKLHAGMLPSSPHATRDCSCQAQSTRGLNQPALTRTSPSQDFLACPLPYSGTGPANHVKAAYQALHVARISVAARSHEATPVVPSQRALRAANVAQAVTLWCLQAVALGRGCRLPVSPHCVTHVGAAADAGPDRRQLMVWHAGGCKQAGTCGAV